MNSYFVLPRLWENVNGKKYLQLLKTLYLSMHQIVTFLLDNVFQYHMKMKSLFIFILSTPQTTQSQSMRKLNPMKSPNTPPTSATRERAG